ncbi:MAG: YceI family protein [Chloroflexia bacterium]|nr:YceI family protein [Chloroflexia bacterium]
MGHRISRQAHVAGAGIVGGMLMVVGAMSPALAQDAPATPSVTCNVEEAVAAAPLVYTVGGEESTASYVAQEELASVGANEVVGTTNAIIGSILFDAEGMPLECSNFAVDMRTLVTDESRRDNYLRSNTLQSDEFPFAIFVVASVEGLDGPLAEGEATAVQLLGDLTLHGVTQPVTWEAEFTRDGAALTGTATTTFVIEDYGMEKPIVGPVVSIGDEIVLNVEITAAREN